MASCCLKANYRGNAGGMGDLGNRIEPNEFVIVSLKPVHNPLRSLESVALKSDLGAVMH
jgi:hypothetical protein